MSLPPFDLIRLAGLDQRPACFEAGGQSLLEDAYVAEQMAQHAPYWQLPNETAQQVAWLMGVTGLAAGARVLHLGCEAVAWGQQFAAAGLDYTGVDSRFAMIREARLHNPQGVYHHAPYHELALDATFAVVMMLEGLWGRYVPARGAAILGAMQRHLHPDGRLVLEVLTAHDPAIKEPEGMAWDVIPLGGRIIRVPHLELTSRYVYPTEEATLDQKVLVLGDGEMLWFRDWTRYFTEGSITALLEGQGWRVQGVYGDRRGGAVRADSARLVVVAG